MISLEGAKVRGEARNSKPWTEGGYYGVVCSESENSMAAGPGLGPSQDLWF